MKILSLVIGLVLWSQAVFAGEAPSSEKISPFYVPNVQDIPECKYVARGLMVETTAPKPELFSNVQGIYVQADGVGQIELKKFSFFDPKNLELLAACTLQVRFLPQEKRAFKGASKSIYIPQRNSYFDKWPEVKDNKNLFVSMKVELLEGFLKEKFEPKIVILHVRYFRSDVNVPENLPHQCATAFPYVDDGEFLQKWLTRSMRTCLYKPYVSRVVVPSENGEKQ